MKPERKNRGIGNAHDVRYGCKSGHTTLLRYTELRNCKKRGTDQSETFSHVTHLI